ncbi:hypothetical protein INR76_07395 [Marixanthomonas sp. SCSIO 43207]|uniref:hypothetical protein n=1 Tax=Marixanthomonas sp. SCSIO 43207 TaxID=2779360 RepID=UPI001CA9A11E|nr:hypothetical protein [Marixanthomonas sp. SCSIO 43207]UAB79965.1 hypothetical protein INR76_07395 [Marixanthomonas sp. SCSIO 43207]
MKRKITLFTFLILFGLIFSACQKEESEFIDETDQDETITANSTLTNLMLRTSQNPGSNDDIIDGNSCSQVKYPVSVIANGQELVIESEADIALIQAVFDQFPNDTDTLEIVFPITLILQDFSEIIINDQAELNALIAACQGQSEIDCVDFIYPIDFFVFNSSTEQTQTITINNDAELYLFLFSLDENDIVSIRFPISVILQDGSTIEVANNQELEDLLTNANCDDSDDDGGVSDFEENLTTGSWYVTYFFDDFDETSDFEGYQFSFATNNTAQATNGSNTVNGTWNVTSSSTPDLKLFFGNNDPFDELDEDWEILEATSEIIRLKHISGGDGSVDYLTYERNPNNDGSNEALNILIENLTTASWFITLYEDDGNNATNDYNGYEFTFFTNGSAIAENASETINGFWSVEDDDSGFDIVFNFENSGSDDPFEELNDDWDVLESSDIILRLSDNSGGSGTDLLTFEREPNTGGGGDDPDPQELRDILQDGTWFVKTYLDDGDNETAVFNGYDFTFLSNQTVSATNGSSTVDGIWIVTLVGQNLNFEFDMDSPINDADDDEYKVLQYTQDSVTFIIRDSSGNIEDTLTFEKN